MKIIADLHLHSRYSRAVSQEMVLPKMAEWAVKKGIHLLGTGDWTHPLWLREIKANLEEAGEGIYGLKNSAANSSTPGVSLGGPPLFILSTEISSIYSQAGKLHRIHNVVLVPSIETAEKVNQGLTKRGANLMSDGRPITGIPAPELVKIILGVDERCLIIPAHIWTPWFSLYGSESGFDSLSECFGEMGKDIYAIETGLSSDPAMNWRIKEIDNRSIVSFSDAHSGPKLGREATVFADSENGMTNSQSPISNISYEDITKAIKQETGKLKIAYTLEFYPEEGKYHFTGHRSCNIKQSPEETKRLGEICSVCGRKLTVGVMHRVDELAGDREQKTENRIDENGVKWIGYKDRPPYAMLVPLQEILAESMGSAPASLKVQTEYNKLVNTIGDFGGFGEFGILLKMPVDEIAKISGEKVAEGIKKVRSGEITVDPGYDGVFGIVKIWGSEGNGGNEGNEGEEKKEQMSLF